MRLARSIGADQIGETVRLLLSSPTEGTGRELVDGLAKEHEPDSEEDEPGPSLRACGAPVSRST